MTTERDILRRMVEASEQEFYIEPMFALCDEARAILAQPAPDTLDAAWARVEAALPDGWLWRVQMQSRGPLWLADAWHRHDVDDGMTAFGPTPIAALHALADALEARKP
jgi:hypothetical protein